MNDVCEDRIGGNLEYVLMEEYREASSLRIGDGVKWERKKFGS